MFTKLIIFFQDFPWQYGKCNGRLARRHRFKGNVQFVLWKKGEETEDGYRSEDTWHDFDSYWWGTFKAD